MSVVAHDGHQASYGETPELIASRQRMAVYLFMGADAVFVLCLVFTYFYLRALNVNGGWLPSNVRTASVVMTWAVTAIAVLGAVIYAWGAAPSRGPSALRAGSAVAAVLLLADVVLQGVQIFTVPFHSQNGAYASTFLVMAGYHMTHLLVGLFVTIGVLARASRGLYAAPDRSNEPRLVGFVLIWIALSAVLFAISLMFTAAPHVS